MKLCPLMSDHTIIRYCNGNCALLLKPEDGDLKKAECAFAALGQAMKDQMQHEETEHES